MSRESHPSSTAADRPPAVLVGVQLQGVSDDELTSSLDELDRLTETLGLRVIGRVTQKRQGLGSANLLGEGKLRELAEYTGGPGFVPPSSRRARRVRKRIKYPRNLRKMKQTKGMRPRKRSPSWSTTTFRRPRCAIWKK